MGEIYLCTFPTPLEHKMKKYFVVEDSKELRGKG